MSTTANKENIKPVNMENTAPMVSYRTTRNFRLPTRLTVQAFEQPSPQVLAARLQRYNVHNLQRYSRRNRTEYPSADTNIQRIYDPGYSPKYSSARIFGSMLEILKTYIRFEVPRDSNKVATSLLYFGDPSYNRLKQDYYRSRIQSTFYNIYLMLKECGYISSKALQLPINIYRETEQTDAIILRLRCFEYIYREEDPRIYNSYSDNWLATIIVRSYRGTDLEPIFNIIEKSAFLGKFDRNAWAFLNKDRILSGLDSLENHVYKMNPREGIPETLNGGRSGRVMNFWLPCNGSANTEERFKEGLQRLEVLEWAFISVFQLGPGELMWEGKEEERKEEEIHRRMEGMGSLRTMR